MNGTKDQHPSYGMMKFSRTTRGGDTVLFGSSIPHRETIRLTLSPGHVERDLNNDWYFSDSRAFIEVEMSQSQFAEAITSMNQGSGIPVTIRRLDGKPVEEPQFTNKRLQFEEEFRRKMERLHEKLSSLTEETEDLLTNKKTINKTDRETIIKQIKMLHQEIHLNIPFISAQFNEQMDKTVTESKAEAEAFIQNKLNNLGLQKLEELKLLSSNNNVKQIENK